MFNSPPDSLFELHKAERRARILVEARKLIARRGVAGLTLRTLAAASKVSVPTVYNLIGGKQAVLQALLQDTFTRVAARLDAARAGGLVERALALCEAGWRELLAEPSYFRGLVHSFVSDQSSPVRRETDARNVELMTGVLMAAQADGELEPWVDPGALAATLYAMWLVTMLGWAGGEITDEALPSTATYGLSLVLLGVARGEAARNLERHIRTSQPKAGPLRPAKASSKKKGARR
jgi:AcrR family transcriptional regulator